MKAGIAIDAWKLDIFTKRLTDAGYTFERGPGLVADTLMLYVITDDLPKLAVVVKEANTQCAREKKRGRP